MDQELREINQRAAQSSAVDVSRNSDTAIAVGANEIAESNVKLHGSALNAAVIEGVEANMKGEDKCSSCVIDINCNDFVQRVCRICHLSAKESGKNSLEMMELGCGCKGELGVAHSLCAEAWFRVRGNR